MSQRSADPEVKAVGAYFSAKALLTLGINGLARKQFEAILARGTGPEAIVAGVNVCLAKIPDLSAGGSKIADWETLTLKTKAILDGAERTAVMQELRNRIIKPGLSNDRKDWARLTLARYFYDVGQYPQAETTFAQLSTRSNYFSQAILGKAWSQYSKKDYVAASGSAYGLLFGNLSRTFSPEAPMIVSMSLFETCNYPEALASIRHFKFNYYKPFMWLKDWVAKKKSLNPASLYTLAVDYIAGKREIPDAIALEWLRSPKFISLQEKVNEAIDEKSAIASFKQSDIPSDKKLADARAQIIKSADDYLKSTAGSEQKLIAAIQSDFDERTQRMFLSLNQVAENIKKIEIEVLGAGGYQLVRGQRLSKDEKMDAQPEPETKDKGKSKEVLDWGRFPAGSANSMELWEDELGFIKSGVKSRCAEKGR